MVTYRITGGNNFDVSIITDASDNHRQFFITEIQGLNAVEVKNGFEIGIQQYNEGQLIDYAIENNFSISSFDSQRNTRTLNTARNFYGIFNGTTSELIANNVEVSNGSYANGKLRASFDFLVTEADIAALVSENYINMLYYPDFQGIYTFFEIDSRTTTSLTCILYAAFAGFDNSFEQIIIPGITFNADTWYNVASTLVDGPNGATVTAEIDNVEIGTQSNVVPVRMTTPVRLKYGTDNVDFIPASMKNFIISAQDGDIVLLSIDDPSTGVNLGTGSDGVPIDITQAEL
jgi:hypothetical protein